MALAAKGELFGEVTIEHAILVSIRDAEGTLLAPAGNEQNFLALPANMDKHRVKDLNSISCSRVFAWVISGPLRYASRVPYRHPPGAIMEAFKDATARMGEAWCKQGSWGMCQKCGSMQPRPLQPVDLRRVARPTISEKACTACRHGEYVPQPNVKLFSLNDLRAQSSGKKQCLHMQLGVQTVLTPRLGLSENKFR